MTNKEPEFSLNPIVNILTPKEIRVSLVPLSQIEDIETSFFWSSIFLSIMTSIFGSLLSLWTTDFENTPVKTILLIFLIIFIILTGTFSFNAFIKRKNARKESSKNTINAKSNGVEKSESFSDAVGLGLMFKLMYLLRDKIFMNKNPRKVETVKELWSEIFSEDPSYEVFTALIKAGVLKRIEEKDGSFLIEFNSEFDPEDFAGQDLI